ncbi:MAG: hypothetical protein DWB48_03715 [Nitrosomonas sp.]|nr:hypothetical protein [Nitrosomonas sp.]
MDFFILRFHGEYTAVELKHCEFLPTGKKISIVVANLFGGRLYSCLKYRVAESEYARSAW